MADPASSGPTPPRDAPGASTPGFEAPRRSRSVTIGAAAALLVVGVIVVASGGLPGGADEPNGGQDEDALPLEEPTTQPEATEPPDGRPGAPTEEPADPGSVRPADGDPGEGNAAADLGDLAELDSPDGTLVVVGSTGIAVADLTTGEVTERRDEGPGTRSQQGATIVDDVIVQARGDAVRLHPLDLSDEPEVLDVDGWRVLAAPGGTVWVGGHETDLNATPRQEWTPVDPTTGQVGASVEVPVQAQVHGATEDGLVISRGGRAFVLDGGQASPITTDDGVLLHAGPGGVLWHHCTSPFDCGFDVTAAGEAPARASGAVALEDWNVGSQQPAWLSEDGGTAVLFVSGQTGFGLGMVDVERDTTSRLELEQMSGLPAVSRDGAWIAALGRAPVLWAPEEGLEVHPAVDVGQPVAVALR